MSGFVGPAYTHAAGFEIPEPYYVLGSFVVSFTRSNDGTLEYSVYLNKEAYQAQKAWVQEKRMPMSKLSPDVIVKIVSDALRTKLNATAATTDMVRFVGPAYTHADGYEIPEPYHVMSSLVVGFKRPHGTLSYETYLNKEAYQNHEHRVDAHVWDVQEHLPDMLVALSQILSDGLRAQLSAK